MGWNINNLAPDGHGWRARLGVLTHDDSAISESERYAWLVRKSESIITVSCSICHADNPAHHR